MMANNSAAAAGWVKSQDPRSGRVFFANHLTRKTQWDPPSGWTEDDDNDDDDDMLPPPPLPEKKDVSNWEVMNDPTTGRPFYVDHARQVTTWTKPEELNRPSTVHSTVSVPTTAYSPLQRINSAQQSIASSSSSYTSKSNLKSSKPVFTQRTSFQESSYYHNTTPVDVDFSDALPTLEFKVKKVTDALRRDCPHCDALFTLRSRRHHCRLCGDVFCDTCSNHRVTLPLEGVEFEKAVRVCDFCFEDVDKGNFFSMRRYLTPLTLYEPGKMGAEISDETDDLGVATAKNVSAALSALTSDLDGMLQSSTGFEEKMTIPVNVLIPAIVKHLSSRSTSDRAVRSIASLLALGAVVNNNDFSHAVYLYGRRQAIDDILTLLERSGSDRKTLFVQEQAARAIFYLTEPSMLSSLIPKQSQHRDEQPNQEFGGVESLDLYRAFRSMLDHSSASKNPNLQRWATACLRNLVLEDQRRTTIGSNDIAAAMATGEPSPETTYESFLEQLVSTGGIMILCSLIGADDADTRTHAMGALGATLTATRAIDRSLCALYEMTGGQAGRKQEKDGDIVRAIVSGGGCGPSLSQLLVSADNGVASMGLDFASSLVLPLLEDPRGTSTLSENYDCRNDNEGLGACREAALAMSSGSCLPALLSLLKDPEMGGRLKRPMELKKRGIETLAAMVMSVSEMGKASPHLAQEAIEAISDEGVLSVMLQVLASSSSQSFSADTPSSRIRECAGIIVAALALCSGDAIAELQSCQAISTMLVAMSDPGMSTMSTLRGDGAPRCLGMLQTASALLSMSWQDGAIPSTELVDKLLEAIDAGAISTLSRILFDKVDWESQDKAVGAMKARDAACRMFCAIFGIASLDDNGIGQNRLFEVVDADAYSRTPPRNVMTGALAVLHQSSTLARNALMGNLNSGPHFHAALLDLVESSLQCVGSMCGSTLIPGTEYLAKSSDLTPHDNAFKTRKEEVCGVACDIVVNAKGQGQSSLLPAMLVGGFGEGTVLASLRLSLAIAQNGNTAQHVKLAMSGILVPISDLLKNALSHGDIFKFSACLTLVRFCGPHVAAGEGSGLHSVRDTIKVATSILTIPIDPYMPLEELEKHESIKAECISALEALSSNASLWSSISKDAFPAIVTYLHSSCETDREDGKGTRCAALRAILQIVQLPSHAVSAARVGLAEPLGKMVSQFATGIAFADGDDDMPLLALEVLHVIAANDDARREARFLEYGVIKAICHALGNSATETPKYPSDCREDLTLWGLEILHLFLSDMQAAPNDVRIVLQSPIVSAFVAIIAREPSFVKAMCSTLLLKTNMEFARTDDTVVENKTFPIARSYGPSIVTVQEPCGKYDNTHHATLALLFSVSVYSCAIDNNASDTIWNTILLRDGQSSYAEQQLAATLCAYYLHLLLDDTNGPFLPIESKNNKDFFTITRPLVRHRLLEGLKTGLVKHANEPYMISMIVSFEVPRMCLTIWQDPALIDLAFEIIKIMVTVHHDDLIHIFVESKSTLLSLFDLLNIDDSIDAFSSQVGEIRRVTASILGSLAENGLLAESVEKFSVKSSAISALAAACLAEDDNKEDDEGELEATSSTMSSRCMQCLVELCTVETGEKKFMQLSSDESSAIAHRLGKKICQMVISRFIERAKLQQYDVEDEHDVMDAPDVKMLCAIAQHTSGLQAIASIGGLHALSLIAAEGELSAIFALQHACKEDPSILLDVDGHISVMKLIVDNHHSDTQNFAVTRKVDGAAFSLLSDLLKNLKGRRAVAASEELDMCCNRGILLITSMIEVVSAEKDCITDLIATSQGDIQELESADDENVIAGTEPELQELAIEQPTQLVKPTHDKPKLKAIEGCIDLEISALYFLTHLLLVDKYRAKMTKNREFLDAVLALNSDATAPVELRSSTTSFLVKSAPFASTDEFTYSLSIFDLAFTFKDSWHLTSPNKIMSTIAEGLGTIFSDLTIVLKCSIVESLLPQWITLIRKFTVARNTGTDADRVDGSLLAYNISLILLAAHKDVTLQSIVIKKDVLVSMINLTQWRYDSFKSVAPDEDQLLWDAAASNTLQIVADVICGTEMSRFKAGLLTKTLMMTPLMMSRPGKAPRKTCDFATALNRAIESKMDAVSYMCAKRILERTVE